ncbi:MAG: amidohydrolase family protein [Chitinophagaceae bacterium]
MKYVILLLLPLQLFSQQTSILFKNVNIVDVQKGKVIANQNVFIEGDRIKKISSKSIVSKGAKIVNASGKYLIPGLWDMHTHIFNQISHRPPNSWYFPLFIANGVTSIREMWTKPQDMEQIREWRKFFAAGSFVGPRIASVGTLVDGPAGLLAPAPGSSVDVVVNANDAHRIVHKLKAAGIDFVKTYSHLSREAYFAIAAEAKKQGMPFAGHVPYAVGADEGSEAGQKTMEHLNQVLETCSGREQELLAVPGPDWSIAYDKLMVDTYDEAKSQKLFSILAKNHTWQVPTLIRQHMHYFGEDLKYFTESPRLKYVFADEQERWKPYIIGEKKFSPEEKNLKERVWRAYLNAVKNMRRAGVEFMSGTDVGTEYIYPGFSLHDELALLVQAGLTSLEALQTATINPAKFLNNSKNLGTIEKGKLADLVLLYANPLEDIHNTQKINAVVANGRLFQRKDLDKLLEDAKTKAQSQK